MDAQNHGWWDQLPQGFIHPFLGKRRDNYHHFKVNFFIRRRIFCYRCRTAPFVLRQKTDPTMAGTARHSSGCGGRLVGFAVGI